MSRFKLFAFIALIAFAFGVVLVSDALAGEKGKGRLVCHSVKWQQIEVGDVEGHIVAVSEARKNPLPSGTGIPWVTCSPFLEASPSAR